MRKIGWILLGLFVAGFVTALVLIFTKRKSQHPGPGPSPSPRKKITCSEVTACPAGQICNDNNECVEDACGEKCEPDKFCSHGFCTTCNCTGLPCGAKLGNECTPPGEKCGIKSSSGCLQLLTITSDGTDETVNNPTELIPYINMSSPPSLTTALNKFNTALKKSFGHVLDGYFPGGFNLVPATASSTSGIYNGSIQCNISNITNPWPEKTIKTAFYQMCTIALDIFSNTMSVFVYDYKDIHLGQGNGTISMMSFAYTCLSKASPTCIALKDSQVRLKIDLTSSSSIFYQSLIYTQETNPMNTCVSNDPGVYLIGNTTNLTTASRCSNEIVSCGKNKYNSIYPTPSGVGKCMCIDCKGTYNQECNDQCIDQDFPARGVCNTGPGARFPTGPSLCTNVTANHCDISPAGAKSACDCNLINCELCNEDQQSFPPNDKYCGDPELYYFHLYDTEPELGAKWHGWAQTGCEKVYQLVDFGPKQYSGPTGDTRLNCPPHTKGLVKRPLPVQNGVFTDWLYAEDGPNWSNKDENGVSRGIFKIKDYEGEGSPANKNAQMPISPGGIQSQPTVEKGYLIPRPPEKICKPSPGSDKPVQTNGKCAVDMSSGLTEIPNNTDARPPPGPGSPGGGIPSMPEETLPNCRFSNGDMGIMMRKCDPNKKSCPGDPNLNDIYCVGRSSKELVSKRLNINKDPTPGSGIAGRRQFFNDIYAYDLNDENGALIEPPVGCNLLGCDSVESGDFTGRPSQLIVRSEGYKLSNNEDLATNQPAYQINQSSASSSTTSPVKTVLYPSYEEAAKDNGLPGSPGKPSANGRSTVVTFQMNASGSNKDNESGFRGNPTFSNKNANMYSISNGEGSGGATDFCKSTCTNDIMCPGSTCTVGISGSTPPYVCQGSPCVRTKNTDGSVRTPRFMHGDAIPISNFDVVYDINGDGDRSWFLMRNANKTQLNTGKRVTSNSKDESNNGATYCIVGDPLSSSSPLVAGDNAFTCAQKLCHMSGNKFCDPTNDPQNCRDKVTGMPPTTWDADPASTTGGCAGSLSPLPDESAGNHGFFSICKSSDGASGGYVDSTTGAGDQLNRTSDTSSKTGAFIAEQSNWGCDCVGQKQWCGCITNAMGGKTATIYPDAADQNVKNSFTLPESKFFYTGQWHDYSGFFTGGTDFGCSPYVYQSIFAAPAEPGMTFTPVDRVGAGRLCTNMGDNEGAGCEGSRKDSGGICNIACPN